MKVLILLLAANLLVVSPEPSLVSFLSPYLNPYLLDYLLSRTQLSMMLPAAPRYLPGGRRPENRCIFVEYIYQSFVYLVTAH